MRNLNKTTRNICGRLLSVALALVMGCLMIAETLPVTAIAADSPTGAPVTEPDNGQPGNAGGNVVVIPQPANPGGNIVIDAQPAGQNNQEPTIVTPDALLKPGHTYTVIGPNYIATVYVTPEGVVDVQSVEPKDDGEDGNEDNEDGKEDNEDGNEDNEDENKDNEEGNEYNEDENKDSEDGNENNEDGKEEIQLPEFKVDTSELNVPQMAPVKQAKVATHVLIKNAVGSTTKIYKIKRSTSIDAKAFGKAKHLKTINIYNKKLTKVSIDAFKGLKKTQISKIKVYVTKKMSKKDFKKLKKALIKAGIKSSNIKKKSL